MRNSRCWWLLCVTAWLLGGCQWLSGEAAADAVAEPLVVASDLDNLPFAGVSVDGTPIGRDVEMMQLLARELGRRIEWRRMPFEDLLPALDDDAVDVVCATLGITPERRERVLFSKAYFYTEIAIVVRVGDGEPVSLADLSNRPVSAARGTTSERAVRQRLPEALLITENKRGLSAADRLAAGEIVGAVMDGPAADAMVTASHGSLRRLGQPLDRERYALALPKDREDLRTALNQALQQLRQRGALAELDFRHGLRAN